MNRRDDKRSSLLEAVPTKADDTPAHLPYTDHKTSSGGLVGRRALQWPGHQSGSQIAAHRANSKHASSAHKKHHPGSPHPTPQIPQLPVSALDAKSSFKGRPGVAPDGQAHSPRSRKDVWDEDQSLLNILSQPSPHRPWSAGGFTGRPQLNTSVSDGQLLPGTVAWNSPRNHIGVHPESLLFNRDPEQLAEDVIGLSQKYASLANEHRLQKVQINKLSASLSRERAEAAELSDLAEIMGLPSPRSRAVSRPGSPGRALRSPYKSPSRPNTAKIRAEQSAVDANMPEWVFTDLQQRLNAAQQLLTQQSMAYEQGPLAGTWPRSRPRSPARRGGRRASAHISLDPNSRLADAFAIYGVPRGITQYMSRKWSSGSPRGASIPLESPIRQSSISGQQQLQEKLAAVRKASHVILLEAMQLRANFPPAVSPEEAEALGPHLDALVNLLHNHSRQVQDELAMLPGAVSSGPSPSGPSPSGPSPTGDRLEAAPGGSGIMDEYLRRMHFSKETPLPSPPQGLPTRTSMPRRWSKTNSYRDGRQEACATSMKRREDVSHPEMHVGKSDESSVSEPVNHLDHAASSARLNKDSDFEPGRDLTPAYRRQEGRSLQQAVDNEQPFGTAWRNQMPMAPVAQHVCASVTEPDASVPEETGSTAAAQAPAVLPGMATSDSPPKIEHTGANKTSVEDMRRPSVVSREVDSVLKALLPYGSGVPKVSHDNDVLEDALPISDTEQFEVHHVNEAAEKHAYLHSQHGMDDVF
ncbi:hypothetical protein WJX79_000558 [Trebouxia sp. C0005]